jgi:hypothetical protein
MAKVGYNYITDEAREKLDSLGVDWKRIQLPNSYYYEVFTEDYDHEKEKWRTSPFDWLPFVGDEKKFARDGFRVWKHPGTGVYYLWIKETVFKKYSISKTDDRFTSDTNPATVNTTDVLDYDPDDDKFRDRLLSIMPMAESGFFQ